MSLWGFGKSMTFLVSYEITAVPIQHIASAARILTLVCDIEITFGGV